MSGGPRDDGSGGSPDDTRGIRGPGVDHGGHEAGTEAAGPVDGRGDAEVDPPRSLPVLQEPASSRPLAGHPTPVTARALDRRTVLKLMAAAAAVPALGGCEPGLDGTRDGGTAGARSAGATNPRAAGTPWDPDLIAPTVPWDGILTEDELATLVVLCDVIIPSDEHSPSASSVGAHEFIDEYVSAPYPSMARDLVLVRGGLVWLDTESELRFGEGARFRALTDEQQHAICDDICSSEGVAPRFRAAARFFDRVRDLTATAFYTTPEGMEDIGYVGNRAIPGPWPAPPPEVLRHLGLEGVTW